MLRLSSERPPVSQYRFARTGYLPPVREDPSETRSSLEVRATDATMIEQRHFPTREEDERVFPECGVGCRERARQHLPPVHLHSVAGVKPLSTDELYLRQT